MRKLVLVAAMLMASASAHAGSNSYSFNIEGHKVRVSVPRNCTSLSCISISAPSLIDKFKTKDEDDEPAVSSKPAPATAAAAAAPASAATAAAPARAAQPSQAVQPALEAAAPVVSSKVTVMPAPATETYSTSSTAAAPTPVPAPVAAPAAQPAPAVVASAPVASPAQAPAAAAPVATSPIGLWMSEKKEGKIRVEDCNGNLCGYAVDAKTGANGAKVLINMKPRGDKWTGRIHDTRSGGTYDSTVAMRGADKLRVQGCAFGGMFCGGETWTRIE